MSRVKVVTWAEMQDGNERKVSEGERERESERETGLSATRAK